MCDRVLPPTASLSRLCSGPPRPRSRTLHYPPALFPNFHCRYIQFDKYIIDAIEATQLPYKHDEKHCNHRFIFNGPAGTLNAELYQDSLKVCVCTGSKC